MLHFLQIDFSFFIPDFFCLINDADFMLTVYGNVGSLYCLHPYGDFRSSHAI